MRGLREQRGFTLRAVAEKLGFSPAYVSDLELGRRGWSAMLQKRYLDVVFVALVVLTGLGWPSAAWAVDNPPCGSVLSGTNTLSTQMVCPSTAYKFNDHATLDCQGNSIKGPASPPPSCNPDVAGCRPGVWGLQIGHDGPKTGVTITNCNVRWFERGLYAKDSTNGIFTHNVFRLNTKYGAMLTGNSGGNYFFNNLYKDNSDEGFHMSDIVSGVQNTSDWERAISNTAEGFYLLKANDMVVQNCATSDNGQPGIYFKNSSRATVTNCTLTNDNIQILNTLGAPWVIESISTP